MKLLITGASGFIGKALIEKLLNESNFQLHLTVRSRNIYSDRLNVNYFLIEDIVKQKDWSEALFECSLVIHTAARVHILKDGSNNPLHEFRQANVDATMNLAKQAAAKGVKRFIFLSTIGIYGSETVNRSITEETAYDPQTPYALSKLEVENELIKLSQSTEMEVVIIRPPLVYAEDAPGNFGKLLNLINKKVFLPFGSIKNARSFISRANLIDFICCCIEHPLAKNQAFVVADSEYISTPDLIKYVRQGMGMSERIIPFPTELIKWLCKIIGKEAAFHQLSCSLQINSSKAKELLNWQPKASIKDSLRQVGANYKENQQHNFK